jgi:prepilin-type N-terminal cleavage/methylation domain-containing protein
MAPKRTNTRGYTIVELMIVVLIIAIMSAIAAPALMESRKNTRLAELPRHTLSIFETARSRAMMRNAAMRVTITKDDGNPATPEIVLTESMTTNCNMFPRNATDNIRGALTRWQIMTLNMDEDRWEEHGIYMSLLGIGTVHYDAGGRHLTGDFSFTTLDLCLNRRGLVLQNIAGFSNPDWIRINTGGSATDSQIVIGFQRREGGLDVGVERVVTVKQGAVARIKR